MIIATVSLLAFPVYSNIDIDSDLMDKYLREGIQAAIKNQLEAKGFKVADAAEEFAKQGCDVVTKTKTVTTSTPASEGSSTIRAVEEKTVSVTRVNCDSKKDDKKKK